MIFLLVIVLGVVVGSFLNVLIDRIPRGENFIWKPSHCDYCKKRLRWFELFPVVSFLVQRGRCLRCHKRLSFQYPGIELLTALGFVLLLPFADASLFHYGITLVIYSCAVVIFFIDLKHQIIPDGALIIVGFVLVLLAISLPPALRLQHAASGLACGFGFFLLWAGTKGRGLGFGDVKLVFLMGLMLGYPRIIVALYVAFLTGAATGVILIVSKRAKRGSRIAFGPFLILGALVAVVTGERILTWFYTLL